MCTIISHNCLNKTYAFGVKHLMFKNKNRTYHSTTHNVFDVSQKLTKSVGLTQRIPR